MMMMMMMMMAPDRTRRPTCPTGLALTRPFPQRNCRQTKKARAEKVKTYCRYLAVTPRNRAATLLTLSPPPAFPLEGTVHSLKTCSTLKNRITGSKESRFPV